MAKARKFASNTGSGVSVYVNGMPDPIRVDEDGYETADSAEIDALKGSPEVVEVKERKS